MVFKIYDILINAFLVHLVSGYGVDKPVANEAVAFFLIHNASMLFLTSLSKDSDISKFKLKIQSNLGRNFIVYHMVKYFVVTLALVML